MRTEYVTRGIVGLAILCCCASALADVQLAKRHYQLGAEMYRQSDYEGALQHFKIAYEAAKKPALLFNIARCQESLGRFSEAIASFEEYVASKPSDASRIKLRIKNLKRLAKKRRDRARKELLAQSAAVEKKESQTPAMGTGRRVDGASDVRRTRRSATLPWTLVGVGLGVLAAGATLTILSSVKAGELEDAARAGEQYANHKPVETFGNIANVAGLTALAVGGAATIAGSVLLYFYYKGARERRAWVAPAVTDTFAGVGGGFRF